MSALNIEHLKLILHRRFAVKVIAGFDIISHSLQIKREFLTPRIQEGPRFLLSWLIFTMTSCQDGTSERTR